jgi:hypothetical protein
MNLNRRIIFITLWVLVCVIVADVLIWHSEQSRQSLTIIAIVSSLVVLAFLIAATTYPGRALEELLSAIDKAPQDPLGTSQKLREYRWLVRAHREQIERVARQLDHGQFSSPEMDDLKKRLASSYASFAVYTKWLWRIVGAGFAIVCLGRFTIYLARITALVSH